MKTGWSGTRRRPSDPKSGLASTATTRSRRRKASSEPSRAVIVVLPGAALRRDDGDRRALLKARGDDPLLELPRVVVCCHASRIRRTGEMRAWSVNAAGSTMPVTGGAVPPRRPGLSARSARRAARVRCALVRRAGSTRAV